MLLFKRRGVLLLYQKERKCNDGLLQKSKMLQMRFMLQL